MPWSVDLGVDDVVHEPKLERFARGEHDLVTHQLVDDARLETGSLGDPPYAEILAVGGTEDHADELVVAFACPFRCLASFDERPAHFVLPEQLFQRLACFFFWPELRVVDEEGGAGECDPGTGAEVVVDSQRANGESQSREPLIDEGHGFVHEAVHGATGRVDHHSARFPVLDALGSGHGVIAGHVAGVEREEVVEIHVVCSSERTTKSISRPGQ